MSPRAALAAAGVVGAAVLAAVLVALFAGRSSPASAPRTGVGFAASISPRVALFGEPVTATVDVVLDRATYEPRLSILGTLAPYLPAGPAQVSRTDAGPLTRLRYRVQLVCLETACVPNGSSTVQLPSVRLRLAKRGGGATELVVTLPPFQELSRLTPTAARADPLFQPPFQATLTLPRPTWSVSPTLLVWLLAVGGGLLLASAAGVVAVGNRPAEAVAALRKLLRRRRRRRSELERALLLVERARLRGEVPEQRKALDRLAAALRQTGDDQLAGSATMLAWAEDPPADHATAGLAAAVQDMIAATPRRVNGFGRARG